MKNSIWFLKSILKQLDESSFYFKEYLNNHSKDDWDLYNIKSLCWISFAQIIDKKLMPSKYFRTLDKLISLSESQYLFSDYSENPLEKNSLKTLEIISSVKSETEKILELEIKRLKDESF